MVNLTSVQQAAQDLVNKITYMGASPLDWPEYTALEDALEDEQAQAVEPATGERAEFEAWASHPDRHGKLPIEAHPNGAYKDKRTYAAYYGWASAKKTQAQQVAVPAGYALAMAVLQSNLYQWLDDVERAECDALIAAGQPPQGDKPC